MEPRDRIERNLEAVRERIAGSCRRANRPPDAVTLIAVTKKVPIEFVRILHDLGQRKMGESRPQSLWEKFPQAPDDIRWHIIGHLQSNKVRRTLPMLATVDSLDRESLAEALCSEATRIDRRVPVLLEVNLTGETAKHGFSAEALVEAYPRLLERPGLQIEGLMAMARFDENVENCRPTFAELRQLRDQLRERFPNGPDLPTLSMGMTNDFEIAIEEGATQVRVGSALFEGTST